MIRLTIIIFSILDDTSLEFTFHQYFNHDARVSNARRAVIFRRRLARCVGPRRIPLAFILIRWWRTRPDQTDQTTKPRTEGSQRNRRRWELGDFSGYSWRALCAALLLRTTNHVISNASMNLTDFSSLYGSKCVSRIVVDRSAAVGWGAGLRRVVYLFFAQWRTFLFCILNFKPLIFGRRLLYGTVNSISSA